MKNFEIFFRYQLFLGITTWRRLWRIS